MPATHIMWKTLRKSKKVLLCIFFLFGIIWYCLYYYIYSLFISYGTKTISDITGISENLVQWIIFASLPMSVTIFGVFIAICIIAILFLKKERK